MFGISAFSQSPFASLGGTAARVEISGVSAQALLSDPTNAVNVTIDAEANVTPSGQAGTSAVAGVGVNAQAVATLPSLAGSVGSVSVTTDAEANVVPSGQAGTSALGGIAVVAGGEIGVAGLAATGAVGTPTFDAEANVTITGQSATSAVGTVLPMQRQTLRQQVKAPQQVSLLRA